MSRIPNRIHHQNLYHYVNGLFVSLGFSKADAHLAADSLVRAELEGAGSHGVSRLPIYARRIMESRIAVNPEVNITRHGSVLSVDGGNGLGQVVAGRALKAAFPVAQKNGIAAAFVRRSNHFGTASYYCQMACDENLVLIAATNSPPGIAPWGGTAAFLGTNPIAFGFPRKDKPPVIVDLSSSIAARGKIILAAKQNKSIPQGWALDENGQPTTDAAKALRGAVLPIGGAKGYALAFAIEILSGVLTGASFGPHVNNLYKDGESEADVGHFFVVLDQAVWMSTASYFDWIEQLIEEIKSVPKADGAGDILYPGERRHAVRLQAVSDGIELSEEVRSELEILGEQLGVNWKGEEARRIE